MALARSTRLATSVAAGLTVLLLASACSSESDDPAEESLGLDEESSSAPTETPETDDGSTDEPETIETSYPDIGLELPDLPEPKKPAAQAALRAFVDYLRGQSQMVRTAKLNDLLTDNATDEALRDQRDTIQYLQENDSTFRGTAALQVDIRESTNRILLLMVCEDASKLRLVEDGESRPLGGRARVPVIATLNAFADGWKVVEYAPQEGSC